MENKSNISNVSWVLVGVRPRTEEKLEEEVLQKLMVESFLPERTYKLFLCGAEVDKAGTLDELEEGYKLLKKSMEEFKDGDYCIISVHEEADLLFLPTELEDDVEEVSGNTDSVQG
jgi:hypothetical protein